MLYNCINVRTINPPVIKCACDIIYYLKKMIIV
jgi:hypothetical protein